MARKKTKDKNLGKVETGTGRIEEKVRENQIIQNQIIMLFMKIFWSVLLLVTTIGFLAALGLFAKAFVLDEKKTSVDLDDFIKDGEYRGVQVHTYKCHDNYISDKGYSKDFSCNINGFYSIRNHIPST